MREADIHSARDNHREDVQAPAAHAVEEYLHQRRAFRAHAAVFAGSMAIIFLVNLTLNLAGGTTGEVSAWWSLWALLGWGIGIAVHGLVVRLARPEGFRTTQGRRSR